MIHNTISLVKQNPDAWDFFAWCNPPIQLIQISYWLVLIKYEQSNDAPALIEIKFHNPVKTGQSCSPTLYKCLLISEIFYLLATASIKCWSVFVGNVSNCTDKSCKKLI